MAGGEGALSDRGGGLSEVGGVSLRWRGEGGSLSERGGGSLRAGRGLSPSGEGLSPVVGVGASRSVSCWSWRRHYPRRVAPLT